MGITVLAVLAGATLAAPAGAQTSPEVIGPYDGSIPFRCPLQDVGTGTDFPDPDADPFCVEFDKTNQNVTDFGLVTFLAQEPARVAAASAKCFYFQRDHWTGSIVQGSQPEVWNWDGNYWFDRARGVGGANVANFRLGGVPMDASPYAPPEYQPYLSPGGGGGVMVELETNPDPTCAAKVDTPEEREQVYADEAQLKRCIEPGGRLRGKRIGRVALGMKRKAVLRRLGPPRNHERGVDRWCLIGRGKLRVAYERSGPAELVRSSGRGHSLHGVAHGDRAARARRRLDLERVLRVGKTRVFQANGGSSRAALVGVSGHRVRWVAVASRDLESARLARALRR